MLKKLTNKQKRMIIIMVLAVSVLIPSTFSLYKSSLMANVAGTSGKLIADISNPEHDETMFEDDTPYFYVTVYNTNQSDTSEVSDVAFDYTLSITNKNNSEGLYSTDNDVFTESLVINDTMSNETATNKRYKVYVSSDSVDETTVNYDVKIDAWQKKMD